MSRSMEPLHNKYRPRAFDEVVGQDAVVRSLRRAVESRTSRTFLLTGPSGTGKTTLARICAAALGCAPADIEEIDAATHTGVDDMRAVTSQLMYRPMGGDTRAVIVDECFAPGTLVATPGGGRAIETLSPGDSVLGALGTQTVVRVIPRKVGLTAVIKFTLGGRKAILCSEEHPFLTPWGWRPARSLHGKTLLSEKGIKKLPSHLLEVWDALYEQRYGHAVLRDLFYAEVRGLWEILQRDGLFNQAVLLSEVWERTWRTEAARTSASVLAGWVAARTFAQSCEETRALGKVGRFEFRTYAYAQPHAFSSDSTEDGPYQGEKRHTCFDRTTRAPRGQWSRAVRTTVLASLAYRWGFGVCCLYGAEARAGWLALKLQVGHWISGVADRFRDRWGISQRSAVRCRSSEGPTTVRARVDRPSREELRDLEGAGSDGCVGDGTTTLYDLEIAEHPSFSVCGVIAHNCHRMSKQAFESLLKILEEPPAHLVWVLCTTEPTKVPKTIVTRCFPAELRPVASAVIEDLLTEIAGEEKMDLGKDQDAILRLCARQADGSPRQALVYLAACAGAKSVQEARELLRTAEESAEAVDLARLLLRGAPWRDVQEVLAKLTDVSPESVRLVVRAYAAKVVLGAKTDNQAAAGVEVLDAFSEPCGSDPSLAPIVVACGRLLLQE